MNNLKTEEVLVKISKLELLEKVIHNKILMLKIKLISKIKN